MGEVTSSLEIICRRPWLIADFGIEHRVLSWSLNAPGVTRARRVAWLEVRDAELPRDLDAATWLTQRLGGADLADAVAFMTSRNVERHCLRSARVEDEMAACLATAGLSNAERVGRRQHAGHVAGTINLLVLTGRPLSQGAMIEAVSVAAQARTLAVLEAGLKTLPDGLPATGTGTDCIAIACPEGHGEEARFAGLHTALGEAVGAAVLAALREAIAEWRRDLANGTLATPVDGMAAASEVRSAEPVRRRFPTVG